MASGSLSCLLKVGVDVLIARSVLTGISYVMTMGLCKLDSNIDHVFCEYYGMSVKELEFLLTKMKRTKEFTCVVEYYNDYHREMLSIWSVMNYLNHGKFDNYWKDSGTISELSEVFGTLKVRS